MIATLSVVARMLSVPSPPSNWSYPSLGPTRKVSSPPPPNKRSCPLPPMIVSASAEPVMVSSPPLASMEPIPTRTVWLKSQTLGPEPEAPMVTPLWPSAEINGASPVTNISPRTITSLSCVARIPSGGEKTKSVSSMLLASVFSIVSVLPVAASVISVFAPFCTIVRLAKV